MSGDLPHPGGAPGRPEFPVATGTADPVLALLRGSATPALAALAALATVAAVVAGRDAVLSTLVGGAMALAALAVAPALHRLCRSLDPTLTVGLAVTAYSTVMIGLGLGFSSLNDTTWLSGGFAGGGVLAVVVAWTVGHLRAALGLRQPLYQGQEGTARR